MSVRHCTIGDICDREELTEPDVHWTRRECFKKNICPMIKFFYSLVLWNSRHDVCRLPHSLFK